ncbi:hypothetical protein OJF2_13430 [Aquisphaera giovannonii]|uniref:PEP-CTERM protein-sorting domain-containing protein n=1 Tax=Aquisphaera giovannonii TaxID=406548 RepID=A0A5B9VX64_9BACT|nr:hypothetical protein [Aquisphaera giovannonii]QEH32858.1 hypothetical protein OJF2_13430 [Aquisphaera giovannonii]
MKNARRRGVLRACIAVAGMLAHGGMTSASALKANVTYTTAGTVDGSAPALALFHGVQGGTFTPSAPFSLGQFEVVPQAAGGGDRTITEPFAITYRTDAIDGVAPTINESPVTIHGWLAGTIKNDGSLSLSAVVDQGVQLADPNYFYPNPAPPFQTNGWVNKIHVNGDKYFLALSGAPGTMTSIEARVDMVPVPEPGSLAVFGTIIVVGAIRAGRRLRRHAR